MSLFSLFNLRNLFYLIAFLTTEPATHCPGSHGNSADKANEVRFRTFYQKTDFSFLERLVVSRLFLFYISDGALQESPNGKVLFSFHDAIWTPVFNKTSIILFFKSLRHLIFQCLVRPNLIVESDILLNAFANALLWGILSAVCLFFFKYCKKGFSNCVVMWTAGGRKWLFDPILLKEQRKSSRCVLLSSITMEYQIFRLATFLISISKCGSNQVRTGVTRYSVTYDAAGIEVQNDTEIYPIVVHPKVCNIADPYLVWTLSCESSFE